MIATNSGHRAQAFRARGGYTVLGPGESGEVEISLGPGDRERWAAKGVTFSDASPEPEPAPPAESDIDALRARADELGIQWNGRWGVPKFTAEIEKAEAARKAAPDPRPAAGIAGTASPAAGDASEEGAG